jgi:transposase-like protein
MRCERQQHLGAALYEHGADRSDQANGFYQRKLVTRLGGMKLAVPQSRSGGRISLLSPAISFFPKTPLGRCR